MKRLLQKGAFAAVFFNIFLCLSSPSSWAIEGPYSHATWDHFLQEFVDENGNVAYGEVKARPELLNQYLDELKKVSFHDFAGWPREEQLALWLNAYHAGLIDMVLKYYPIQSIQDIPGVWERVLVRIGTQGFSANQIRQNYLIGQFGDEKVHFALACGARSCPPLKREAYTGPRVEGQLYLAAQQFVNDEDYNEIVPGNKKIVLSRIFKWHARDFILDFGQPRNDLGLSKEEAAVLSFIAYYTEDVEKADYLESRRYKIKYAKFDWQLNETLPGVVA